jgi:hypothetical protein
MSSNPNLNAFCDKNKKQTTKVAKAEAPEASNQQPSQAPATEAESKPAKQQKKLDYESSEEEKTDLIIDQGISVLNKNDVEAQKRKRKQEQEDAGAGWSRLENQSKESAFTKSSMVEKPGMLMGAAKGAKDKSEINFTRSKPTFTNNKNKKRLDEDFPELGEAEQNANADGSEVSKKDQANIGFFGAQAKSSQPRTEQPTVAAAQEERKEATKPVFTSSKKKVLKGGDEVDSIQSSKQNYDFGRLNMSTASNKVAQKDNQRDGEDAQNGEGQQPRERKPKTYNDAPVSKPQERNDFIENDFEVVQEKRRTRF